MRSLLIGQDDKLRLALDSGADLAEFCNKPIGRVFMTGGVSRRSRREPRCFIPAKIKLFLRPYGFIE
ncbi:MAG: hypothetical protein R3F44_01455 [Candidatus Competibacteraceae bacterium]